MRKTITIISVMALSLAMLAGPAFAELLDTGTKNAVIKSCTDSGGTWDANGWGNDGNPTCVFEDEEAVVHQDNNGVLIELGGGTVTYEHLDTTTQGNDVTGGAWDEGTSDGGGMCITFKKGKNAGETFCPKG
jgi:hypothetical protein